MTRGERVIAFLAEYAKTPEGSKVGQPLQLAEFQKKFILDIYDNPAGTRRAILTLARKNGKTALVAGLMLAHICGPEATQNAQIVSGALSRDQASLVFNLAVKMIQLDPRLAEVTRIIPSGRRIIGLSKNVEYRALAADGTRAQGLSPIFAILDEVGQIRGPTSAFLDAILTSQGAHESPITVLISTQSASDSDFLSQIIDDSQRSGDPKTVCHVYAADEDADLLDESQWKKANPALGLFRSEQDLREQLSQAARLPSMEASARNLLLNQRISLTGLWLAPAPWKACSGKPNFDVFRERGAVMGLDLSSRIDLTAAVLAQTDDDGIVHLFPYVFTPLVGVEERSKRDRAPYSDWIRDGYMIGVSGPSIDYDFVAQYLRDELDDKGIDINSVCFDRWRIDLFRKSCDEVGAFPYADWYSVGQGYKDMSPRCEAFESALLGKRMLTGGHPLLNLAAANAVAVRDASGNTKIDKAATSQRIDPLIAAIMALYEVTESENSGDFSTQALII